MGSPIDEPGSSLESRYDGPEFPGAATIKASPDIVERFRGEGAVVAKV
jgi:hypothetical protein